MTVLEYWQEVLALELSLAAHLVYWALRRGYVNEDDDWSLLKEVPYDHDEVSLLCAENKLGVGEVKLFATRCEGEWYAFYFAADALSAKLLHEERFGVCADVVQTELLQYRSVTVEGTGRVVDFLTLKKERAVFPVFVGLMQAGVMVLHQWA